MMSDLPVCKLCDNYPVNYHTGAFGIKHHCDNKQCTLHSVLFTESQWRSLMGEASPEPESAEPVAILCRQTDESKTEWFDHDPLIPGSTRHKIRANHGGWELLPVYASQPARGCEPITKYVELTREQAFEHLKTNSFHLERTGLYKLVINPDWKPQPPQE